ncbi:FMN-dependent NADH-azoreductase [Dyadobacter koreensis]|uniref:FMN dependent NADH:quinone oxidoreductase n=1 Tax=Dyadobacter koreensis TaxID=408657 RepID=A0A1H6YFN6_9BACT|nr:NAD(P)H-dependent oxidoreductase [Dyadobacter koreensis]SEJ40059.1 FMN-dependent NADH-azoreductase [Dyadobacter koreensis]
MKVLHIDSSIRNGRSVSKALSQLFVNELTEKFKNVEIDYLDLSINTPSHPSALFIQGNYLAPGERTPEMIAELEESERLVDKMHDADIYVLGMPMYNFSVPSNFKTFIDNIVRINRTFQLGGQGAVGLLNNKKVFVINTRGSDFAPAHMTIMDQLTPYLRVVFGFMGLTDITFIDVHPVQFAAAEERAVAIAKAEAQIKETVEKLNIEIVKNTEQLA